MKKILIINTTFDKGGAAKVARDLFYGLQGKDGRQLFFAYGRGGKSSEAGTFYFGNFLETLLHICLVRFFGLEGFGSYFATKKLINYIKREKFDLVNLHNLHGYYLNFFSLIKFLQTEKIPVVWNFHDEWPITSLFAHSMGCAHCKSGIGKCTNSYSYPHTYFPIFSRYMLKTKKKIFGGDWNLKIVSPAQWLSESVKNSFLGKFEVRTIRNGVDTNLFKPTSDKNILRTKYAIPLDKKIILFSSGNLNDANKGAGHILDLAKSLIGKNYLFLGLGGGSLPIMENLKLAGYINEKQKLADYLALADIFCSTSLAETMPLTLLEAMSAGLPVIAFDIPATREIVNDKVGKIVLAENKQLADFLVSLLSNEQDLKEKGVVARQIVVENFSQAKFLEDYFKMYNELLK